MHHLLLVLGAMLLIGFVAVWVISRFSCQVEAACDTLGALARAADARAFEGVVWRATSGSPTDAASAAHAPTSATVSIAPLRWMMFIDSMVIVSAYLGLLISFMITLYGFLPSGRGQGAGREEAWWKVHDWTLQFACLLAVAAAVFDVAENGMTVRAAEDSLERLLADPTVADVHLATQLKWTLIACASLALGVLANAAKGHAQMLRRSVRAWLVAGAVACGATAGLLLVGQYSSYEWLTGLGGLTFGLELLLIGIGLWKVTSAGGLASNSPGPQPVPG